MMKTNSRYVHTLVAFLAVALLLVTSCTSTDPAAGRADATPPKSSTAMARKKLALLYLSQAAGLLESVNNAGMKRQARLDIAYTYALLGEREAGKRLLPPPPPVPPDAAHFDEYLQYLTVVAALGEYGQLEESIERLDNPQAEGLIRGYMVYYDAVLRNTHLSRSLKDASKRIDKQSDPHARFYLGVGYQLSGDTEKARKACLLSSNPIARFTTCASMAATMGMVGELDEASFYLDQAERALYETPEDAPIDPYARMIYGRALALAGKVGKAKAIYLQLDNRIDAMYIGSAMVVALFETGSMDDANLIIRDVTSKFNELKTKTAHPDYLYDCYGDLLISIGSFIEYDRELKRTSDPLLKARFLLGGAESLADTFLYDQ